MAAPAVLAQFIKRQRIGQVRPYIAGRVLEIGCKDGATLDLGCQIDRYVGFDIDREALATAQQRHPADTFAYRNVEQDEFGYEGEFDVVLMIALIEHILNQRFLLEQCHRALGRGGRMVITTPTAFGNDVVHYLGSSVGLFHRSVREHHVVIYNKTRLRASAAMTGFELESYRTFQLGCNQLAVLRKR